jgi:hypothetical protein
VRVHQRPTIGSLVVAALLLAPVALSAGYDSFPLSTYPMFAGERDRVAPVATVIAVEGEQVKRLSPELIGGTDEPMLAAQIVARAIHGGSALTLCSEVADRAARQHVRGTLQVVTERYDTRRWFDGVRVPVDRTIHATCEVTR